MNIDNSQAQMKKGILELCILAIAAHKDVYASDILREMKERKLIIVEGTLYPLLTRLKNEGLLSYRWEESQSGPPRKYYVITETGKLYQKSMLFAWKNMKKSVDEITQNTQSL
ncbi:MAG: PadR family transcriptional regulator [Bacteroidales bacterium]|jgi:PadR family transcriptional regulator PadR|nr:PadR family transcriptional regulator [Bacteroidales bacterium]